MLRFEAFINNCFVKTVINLTVGQKANLKGPGLEISKLNDNSREVSQTDPFKPSKLIMSRGGERRKGLPGCKKP